MKQVRSTDNAVLFRNSQELEARGTLVRLTRNMVVFEVYNPYSIVQLSEVLRDLKIRRGERDIYTGRAVVTNLVSTGLMLIVSASLVDPWSDLVDLAPGQQLRDEVQHFINDWTDSNEQLFPPYRLCVSNIRNFLEELSRWLEQGEMVAGISEPGADADQVEEFVADVDTIVGHKLEVMFGQFEEIARQVEPEQHDYHKAYVCREVHPLMMCAPFMYRAFTKPLGYAGDYEMVNMIIRNRFEGQNTYAKVINSMPLRTDTAEAHRNRIKKLKRYLEDETKRLLEENREIKILNIGCGPAAELQQFISENALADRLNLELIDFNQQTLEYAESMINQAIRDNRRQTNVRFVHQSVHELLKQASSRKAPEGQDKYDLVYCAGLFDYLSDRICGKLLKLFYAWTAPGGLVLATNVHPRESVRAFMEHIQEWNLILRDEKQMLDLAPDIGQQAVCTEETGVNVFIEIRKP